MKHSFETPLRAAALALLLAAGCAKTHVVPAGEFADKRAVVDARVNAALDGRRFEEALGIADSLIAAGLDDSRSLAERAQALAGLGRETEAIAAFEQALLKDYGSCEHHLQFATYLMRIGKSGRADTEFTEARRLCPGSYSPLIYRNLAVSAIKLGKSGLAEEYVKEGLLSSPNDPYLSGLKAMLIAREHPVQAESLFAKARGAGYAPFEFLVQYGLLLVNTGRPAEGARILEKASSMEPGNREVRIYVAEALDREQKYGEAEAILRDLLAAKDDADVRQRLARVLFHEGNWAEALKLYMALENSPEVMDKIAMSLHGLGRQEEAVEWERKALAAKPDWPQAMINLAVILASKGELDEASSLLERVLTTDPGNAAARSNLERLKAARKK